MLNAKIYKNVQDGIGGEIRKKYEDFYVEEIPKQSLLDQAPILGFSLRK